MVVTDPILVAGRRPGGLDAPDEAVLGQDSESVVYRLSRNGTDLGTSNLGDSVRRSVEPTRHRPQYGQTLGRDLDTVFAKEFGRIVRHGWIVCSHLD